MTLPTQTFAQVNPEAARQLALSLHYLRRSDFARALHYSRLPMLAGEPSAAINLLATLVLTRKFDAALEVAALLLTSSVDHTVRRGVLETVLSALYFTGARDGDCSQAFAIAHELAAHSNLMPHLPHWQGQPLQGRSLLVSLSEAGLGGFGDFMMWARFLPAVAAQGGSLVVQCPPQLRSLFAAVPGVAATCDYEDNPSCDFGISIMEIPHVVGLRAVPQGNPFSVGRVRAQEHAHAVAISWGASWSAPYMDRSCALAEFLPLALLPHCSLYSVQKGAHQRQLYPPPQGMDVIDLAPRLSDFLETATVLQSMDAVVTTDNVVANLACSLGCPTFVLVPKCADWRWGEAGRTPWYPSARVYQQSTIGDWDAPIARLTSDLAEYLRDHAGPLRQPSPDAEPPNRRMVQPSADAAASGETTSFAQAASTSARPSARAGRSARKAPRPQTASGQER